MRVVLQLPILVFACGVLGRTITDSTGSAPADALFFVLYDDLTDPETADLIPETISDLLVRPYDLSNPDDRILQLIPTLTELESMKIRLMRNAKTEDDLRGILSEDLYNRTRPFLSLKPQPSHLLEIRSRISADPDVETEEEYVEEKYHGSSLKSSNLARLYTEHVHAGIIQSKDAGEPLFLDHAGGFCALAEPIGLSSSLFIERAVIGDYSIGYGEGLILLRSYARSKSSDAITPLGVNPIGIGNYLSTSAYRYYRGAATSLRLDDITVDVFYSNRLVDATLSDTGTVTSLSYTGYHRTSSEQQRRQSTKQSVSGGNILYSVTNDERASLNISATGLYLTYDRSVQSTDSLKTRFVGSDLTAGSVSWLALFGNYSFRGELATSISDAANDNAFTATLLAKPFTKWEVAANFRLLPEGFLSPLGGVFGDNASDVQNETGGYFGLRTSIVDALTLEGYADVSSRIQQTPTNENVLATEDFRLRATWETTGSPFRLSLESRYRIREELTAVRSDTIEPHSKLNLRLRPAYDFSDRIQTSVHAEFVQYSEPDIPNALGYLIGASVKYRPIDPIRVAASSFFYTTDSYDSRIYITEPEVPGAGGFTFLYGNGVRYSFLVSAVVFEKLHLHAKFSESRFVSPSTDADQVNSFLTLQAELRL